MTQSNESSTDKSASSLNKKRKIIIFIVEANYLKLIMSWSLFSRHSASGKKNVVSKQSEREIERELKKLDELDESTKKLYKDGKRCIEANNAVGKAEQKIVQSLSTSGLCQLEPSLQENVESWGQSLDDLHKHRQELNTNIQKAVVEPMKKLGGVFPSVQAAVKKREQSLQEYSRTHAKVNKYQDRDRTGHNIVKLDSNKKALEAAKDEFMSQDQALRQDLPKLYDGRLEYIRPTFDALMRSQLQYYTEANKVYSEVSSELFQHSKLTEQERKARINQKLTEIRSLSITVDD